MNGKAMASMGLAVVMVSLGSLVAQPPRAGVSLGVVVEATAPEAVQQGMRVRDVPRNSPADKAGMKTGDLIVEADNNAVSNLDTLMKSLRSHKPGDKIPVVVMREGEQKKLTVTLGEGRDRPQAPESSDRARRREELPGSRVPAFLGIRTQELNPQLREHLGVRASRGVVVVEVSPNTPAEKAGFHTDDVITAVNGHSITSPEELRSVIRQAGVGAKAKVQVERGQETKELSPRLTEAPMAFPEFPRGVPLPQERFPGPDLSRPIFPERSRLDQLEKHVQDLENRIRELERKLAEKSGSKK